jgi:hypothetical protein
VEITLKVSDEPGSIARARQFLDALEASLYSAKGLEPRETTSTSYAPPFGLDGDEEVDDEPRDYLAEQEDWEEAGPAKLPPTRHQHRHFRIAKYLASRKKSVSARTLSSALDYPILEISSSLQYLRNRGLVRNLSEQNSHRWKATDELRERGVVCV